jgi:hypothetical protein
LINFPSGAILGWLFLDYGNVCGLDYFFEPIGDAPPEMIVDESYPDAPECKVL